MDIAITIIIAISKIILFISIALYVIYAIGLLEDIKELLNDLNNKDNETKNRK